MFKQTTKKDIIELLAVVGALLGLSWAVLGADLDILMQSRLFDQDQGWIHGETFFWRLLYDHGPKPGLILGLGAVLVFLMSFLLPVLAKHRKKSLFLTLVLIFGTGIVVEAFKGITARPRPRHIEFFQGDKEFLPVFSIKKPVTQDPDSALESAGAMARRLMESKGRYSFPSGHAAIAFYLLSMFFVFRDSRKRPALIFLGGGISYGLLVGGARMAQGGHFFSDVIWAGGVVYLSCWFFYHLLDIRSGNEAAGSLH